MRYEDHLEKMHTIWKEAYQKGFLDGVHATYAICKEMEKEAAKEDKRLQEEQRNRAT